MKNSTIRLPGKFWWLAVFIPIFNWAVLLYIAGINSSIPNIVLAIVYGLFTAAVPAPESTIATWAICGFHNIVLYASLMTRAGLPITAGNNGYGGPDAAYSMGASGTERRPKKLPGKLWWVIACIPGVNWVALLYISVLNLNYPSMLCAISYALMTFAVSESWLFFFPLGLAHYAIMYSLAKDEIDWMEKGKPNPGGAGKDESDPIQNDVQNDGNEPRWATEKTSLALDERDFSDITIQGETERTQRIPAKPVKQGSGPHIPYAVGISHEHFPDAARKYADREGEPVPFVPFEMYWPTYEAMNPEQESWYFYWRSQVRSGNYIDTDLSYVFLYIYEILSGVGWQTPQEGYFLLMEIWSRYRERFPKLDGHLIKWTFDFAQLHSLEYEIPFGDDLVYSVPQTILDLLIQSHAGDIPLKLPFTLIAALCDYHVFQSEFYKDGNQLLLREAVPRTVALADAAMRKKVKRGILDEYGPRQAVEQEYCLFESAVCPEADSIITVNVKPYSVYGPLRKCITELVGLTENVLRQMKGYDSSKKATNLTEETVEAVEHFLRTEYGYLLRQAKLPDEKREEKRAAREEKVQKLEKEQVQLVDRSEERGHEATLDFDVIDRLREESEAVRTALAVEGEISIVEKVPLTNLGEISAIYSALSSAGRDLLHTLKKSNWVYELDTEIEQLVAEINNLAEGYLGGPLLFQTDNMVTVDEQYCDELAHICDNPPPLRGDGGDEEQLFDPSLLDRELKEFVECLRPEQKKVVYAVLILEDPEQEIKDIAEEHLTMPEILLDDINAVALQTVGDIIIDFTEEKPGIVQEYASFLRDSITPGRD